MQQNIYDDERFFENYAKIRNSEKSFNELLEQPAMKRLLPDVAGWKRIQKRICQADISHCEG